MKKIIYTILLLVSISTYSQIKVTGYFDKEIGVSYAFSDKFQSELRMNDNLGIDFNAELSVLYKFIHKENYNLNSGFGVSSFIFSSSDLESVYIPLQLEILPFENLKNFGIVLETAYHFAGYNDGLRNSVGLRYIF